MSEPQVYLHLVMFSFSFQSELGGQVSRVTDGPISRSTHLLEIHNFFSSAGGDRQQVGFLQGAS